MKKQIKRIISITMLAGITIPMIAAAVSACAENRTHRGTSGVATVYQDALIEVNRMTTIKKDEAITTQKAPERIEADVIQGEITENITYIDVETVEEFQEKLKEDKEKRLKEDAKEETSEKPAISDEEYELLCSCVQAEAGNQGSYGMRLVCAVILNRVDAPGWGDTITEVITAKNQFSSYTDGGMAKAKKDITDETKAAVDAELEERTNYKVIAFRTGHFHHNSQWKDWEQVGDHYFSIEAE